MGLNLKENTVVNCAGRFIGTVFRHLSFVLESFYACVGFHSNIMPRMKKERRGIVSSESRAAVKLVSSEKCGCRNNLLLGQMAMRQFQLTSVGNAFYPFAVIPESKDRLMVVAAVGELADNNFAFTSM